MTFKIGKYQIEIINESDFDKDNLSDYKKIYLSESNFKLPTKLGIKILENGIELNSALIGAEGGASGLHETSQIFEENRILICCGDSIFCLDLPTLNLIWKTKTDELTSFEIFKIDSGYIIHGEMEVSRIDEDGKIIWQNGGADIFITQNGKDDFEIKTDYIKATDWENRIYKWDFNGVVIE